MEKESRAIETVQELFQDEELPDQLALIKANFQILANSIIVLEERLSLADSVKIVKKVEQSLHLEPFANKFAEGFEKNPDIMNMFNISKILSGETVESSERAQLPADPCLLYTSPSPRDRQKSRMPSSA